VPESTGPTFFFSFQKKNKILSSLCVAQLKGPFICIYLFTYHQLFETRVREVVGVLSEMQSVGKLSGKGPHEEQ
jgi:hypothetical protein